jgi:hypothetical protein
MEMLQLLSLKNLQALVHGWSLGQQHLELLLHLLLPNMEILIMLWLVSKRLSDSYMLRQIPHQVMLLVVLHSMKILLLIKVGKQLVYMHLVELISFYWYNKQIKLYMQLNLVPII